MPPCSTSPSPSPLAGLGDFPLVPCPGREGLPAGLGTGEGLVPVPGSRGDFGAVLGVGTSVFPEPSVCFGGVGLAGLGLFDFTAGGLGSGFSTGAGLGSGAETGLGVGAVTTGLGGATGSGSGAGVGSGMGSGCGAGVGTGSGSGGVGSATG